MIETILNLYEMEYFRFILTLLLSFLTGLEMREYGKTLGNAYFIGTVRTYTLIGMVGYIFYILDPSWRLYIAGLGVLALLFGLFYHHKLQEKQKGIITLLAALLVYAYAPIIMTQPLWFTALIFVSIIFVVNAKTQMQTLLESVDNTEIITFSKLMLLSVVIWPLLPTTPISSMIPMSFSKVWMAVVVVSGISYIGYLLQRYFFKEKGFLVSGILGGIYSSTATTVVLSRQSKTLQAYEYTFVAAIMLATGMMHARLLVIIGFLNFPLFQVILLPLGALGGISLVGGYILSRIKSDAIPKNEHAKQLNVNPLELGVALVFAMMFVLMSVATHYFVAHYGISGLNIMALISGFTDIDPFILSLINTNYSISQNAIISAILIAVGSNNLFKGIIALALGSRRVGWISVGTLGSLSILTVFIAFIIGK
ncbi:MAG: DUF4010 domain-containing protein [Sulfuricurvum sp.]|nr:DUF4010 domain-containing protein [Sulfuricurvum sp.]